MQGEIELGKKDIEKLDSNMTQIFGRINTLPIDEDQNNVFSTRFFNALGWTIRKPRLVSADTFEAEFKKSPVQAKLYHSIAALNRKPQTGLSFAKQLISDHGQKQFLSHGVLGRGTYVTADIGKIYNGLNASEDSWEYGKTDGSVQLTLCFNENARIIEVNHLKDMFSSKVLKVFPKLSKFIASNERGADGGLSPSVMAPFFGYNVVRRDQNVPYYVAVDRSVYTISDIIEQRVWNEDEDEDEFKKVQLVREEQDG